MTPASTRTFQVTIHLPGGEEIGPALLQTHQEGANIKFWRGRLSWQAGLQFPWATECFVLVLDDGRHGLFKWLDMAEQEAIIAVFNDKWFEL